MFFMSDAIIFIIIFYCIHFTTVGEEKEIWKFAFYFYGGSDVIQLIKKRSPYTGASWYSAESILFNLWSPGVIWGHNRVKHFYISFNGGNLWKFFQKPTEPKKVQIYWQGDLMAIKKSNIACVYRRNISQYDSGERCDPWASCLWMEVSIWEKNDGKLHHCA
jgi:hypothetical protein